MEQASFDGLEASELRELLTAHVAMDPQIERPFTLFGPAGQPIAGSPLGPPDLEVLGRRRISPSHLPGRKVIAPSTFAV